MRVGSTKLGGGGNPCMLCGKRCYPAEEIRTTTDSLYHQECFRCTTCNRKLTKASYVEDHATKRPYCQAHYKQLAAAAGLAAVAQGGVDASAGTLVVEKKKEEELEDAERLEMGSAVNVSVDDLPEAQQKTVLGGGPAAASEPFVSGVITAIDDGTFSVEVDKLWISAPADAVSLADVDGTSKVDNLQLLHLTEANLLQNLRLRFGEQKI